MPWWGWLAAAALVLLTAAVASYAGIRRSVRGRAFLALGGLQKFRFARALLADPSTPLAVRGLLALLAAYLVLPFDIIPDFVPVAGQLDDLAAIIVAVGLVLVVVRPERIDAALAVARRASREQDPKADR